MINSLTFYLVGYVLTFTGFLLGKATREEHEEIKRVTLTINRIFILLIYSCFFILIASSPISFGLLFFSLVIYFFSVMVFEKLMILHNLIFYSVSFFVLMPFQEWIFLLSLPIIALGVENSFEKFKANEHRLEIIFLLVIYLILRVLV